MRMCGFTLLLLHGHIVHAVLCSSRRFPTLLEASNTERNNMFMKSVLIGFMESAAWTDGERDLLGIDYQK